MSSVGFVLVALVATILGVQANIAYPHVPCFNDENCKSALGDQPAMKCMQNTCMCLPGGKAAYEPCRSNVAGQPRDSSSVVPLVGRVCNNEANCNLTNGVCSRITATCVCEDGYISANNNTQCLKAVNELEGSCERTEQCAPASKHSTCLEGKCRCKDGYYQVSKTKCLKKIGLGASCKSEEETCYQASGKDATKNVLRCATDLQKCECDNSYNEVNGVCELASGAGQVVINLIPTAVMLIVLLVVF